MRGRKSAASAAVPTAQISSIQRARWPGCAAHQVVAPSAYEPKKYSAQSSPGGITVEVEQRGQRRAAHQHDAEGAPHAAARPAAPPTAAASAARTAEVDGHVPDAGRERLGMRQALQQQRVRENCAPARRGPAPPRRPARCAPASRRAPPAASRPRRAARGGDSAATAARERPREGGPAPCGARAARGQEAAHHQEDLAPPCGRSRTASRRARAPDHPARRPAMRRRRSGAAR